MRRGREKKVRGQTASDKVGGHARQTDEQNEIGVEGDRPERTGVRTAQTSLLRVFLVLRPRTPASEGKRKGYFYKCQKLVTWGRGRKRSSPHSPPEPPWYCSAVPSFSHPGPGPKKPETHTGAQKVFFGELGREIRFFSKKNSRLVAD